MGSFPFAASVLLGVLSLSGVALADEPAAAEETEATPPERPGTHFLGEIQAGSTTNGGPGLSASAILGAGGKFVGFPLRFYALSELGYAQLSHRGALQGTGVRYFEKRTYVDMTLGVRTYVPIYEPVRLFVDLMGGGAYVTATVRRTDHTPLRTKEWRGLGTVALGVQARVLYHLSLGLRLKWMFVSDGLTDLRDAISVPNPRPQSFSGSLSWHF